MGLEFPIGPLWLFRAGRPILTIPHLLPDEGLGEERRSGDERDRYKTTQAKLAITHLFGLPLKARAALSEAQTGWCP